MAPSLIRSQVQINSAVFSLVSLRYRCFGYLLLIVRANRINVSTKACIEQKSFLCLSLRDQKMPPSLVSSVFYYFLIFDINRQMIFIFLRCSSPIVRENLRLREGTSQKYGESIKMLTRESRYAVILFVCPVSFVSLYFVLVVG